MIIWGSIAVVAIILLCVGSSMFATNGPDTNMVVQTPFTGTLTWYTGAGTHLTFGGTVTRYKKRDQFWFSERMDQGKALDESLTVRFNDGAHANISGSISWEMPGDIPNLNKLHSKYGSQEAVAHQLVRTVLESAIYTCGPFMSSTESYAERKNELVADIKDQVDHGMYETEQFKQTAKDPISGQDKSIIVVRTKMDASGKPVFAQPSPLIAFGITTSNLSINNVKYPPEVESQIKQQQNAAVAVQISIAEAKQAEQRAITIGKQGEANAAEAKWKQEVVRSTEVTMAQKDLDVADLAVKTAEKVKQAKILQGQGEAAARQLIMAADGGLDKKLDAYKYAVDKMAGAIQNYKGNWVPMVVNGGGNAGAGSGAQTLVDAFTLKTLKDLGLNMSVQSGGGTDKQ
jgi:regulator of protease activity HflC (stomatin/prohibitin superfamily)